jgi:hypothetical protein
MVAFKPTLTIIDESGNIDPIKYFVSKHSIYPSFIDFDLTYVNISLLYNKLKFKFGDECNVITQVSCIDTAFKHNAFYFIHENKDNSIMFYFNGFSLIYYANVIDEGLANILLTFIQDCHDETEDQAF